jgi:hypothetical protein
MSAGAAGRRRRLWIVIGIAMAVLVIGGVLKYLGDRQETSAEDAAEQSAMQQYPRFDIAAAQDEYNRLSVAGSTDYSSIALPRLPKADLQTFSFGSGTMTITYRLQTSISGHCLAVRVTEQSSAAPNTVETRATSC